jgi:AraC-like DNA-binding protein
MAASAERRDATAVWDITTPSHPGRLAGVSMAGFRQRGAGDVDLRPVPFPAVTLGIDLSDASVVVGDDAGAQQRGSVVIGLAPHGLCVHGRDVECLQVRLSPLVAHAVLGTGGDSTGAVIALDDLWGDDARRTEERLRDATSWEDRFAIAEDALVRRLDARRAADPEVAFAWAEMEASQGLVRIEAVAAETGWSRKRLWSRFRAQVGLTPKRAAQLVRFDRAARRLAAGHGAAMAAAESGYADQSHLHRDAFTFAGLPPSAVAIAPWLAVDDIAWPAAQHAAMS